jgi:cyclophilin family peptidyl-prolyl cis-trans isomerase
MSQLPSKIRSLFRFLNGNRGLPTRREPTCQPRLEALEDRFLPAVTTGTITGLVFVDANANGVKDAGEVAVPGVAVNLTGTTSTGTAANASVSTDAAGAFTFQNILPGTYQVSASSQSDLVGAAGAGGAITLAGGQTVTRNFTFLGLAPTAISIRQFLTTTTSADFPDTAGTPGSGSTSVGPRSNSSPVVGTPISDVSVAANSSPTTINLAGNFTDPDIANSTVTFNTSDGPLNVTLFDLTAPQSVANFYDYVTSGDYNNTPFTRLVSNFVLQGGGAVLQTSASGSTLVPTANLGNVPNEFGASNVAGTLALAQSGGDINSGNNEYFFNLVNNASSLDPQKFTVFGQVASSADFQVLNTLAATPTKNESGSSAAPKLPGVDLQNVPLKNYNGTNFPTDATAANFLLVNSISVVNRPESLTYAVVGNTNPGLVTAAVVNERLTLTYAANQTGTAAITVQATDSFGATVQTTFNVKVS